MQDFLLQPCSEPPSRPLTDHAVNQPMDKELSTLIPGIRGASANTQEAEQLQKEVRGRKAKTAFEAALVSLFGWYVEEEA